MWFLVCPYGDDDTLIGCGRTPQDAYNNFMDIHGGYHYHDPVYYNGQINKVKTVVTVEEVK